MENDIIIYYSYLLSYYNTYLLYNNIILHDLDYYFFSVNELLSS